MTNFAIPWKEALNEYFQEFLVFFPAPEIHAGIDWNRGCSFLDRELLPVARDAEVRRQYVDCLVKVWLKDQGEWGLIHVEVQATRERNFAWRMHAYNYRLRDKHKMTVVSLAVLGDDHPHWRPHQFSIERCGTPVGMRFPVLKILDYAEQGEMLRESRNSLAKVIMAHLIMLRTRHDPDARCAAKLQLVQELDKQGWRGEKRRSLLRVIDWMVILPKPQEATFWDRMCEFENRSRKPFMTTPERIEWRESWAKGFAEGRREGLMESIALVLEVKFAMAGLGLMPEISVIKENAKLEAVLRAIPTAASPEELRHEWTG